MARNKIIHIPIPPPAQAPAVGLVTLTTLTLSSVVGGVLPWTVGHVFAEGDVPSGSYVSTDASDGTQAEIRNRWPDGSARVAVISGRCAAGTVAVGSTDSAPGGSNIAEPSTSYLNSNISVTLTGDGAGTYTPQTAATNGITAWDRTTARKVREFLGPVMSEFHYYTPTADSHVTIWWYVRVYSDRTEVETLLENGWLDVASPTSKSYTVTVAIGGSTVYGPTALTHYHHTRWSRVDWIGTDPQVRYLHDDEYLRASKMVPNYGYHAPTAAAFTGLASAINPTPFVLGQWSSDMSDTGYQQAIGILPRWEALYAASGDSRARDATIANWRGSGRWPVHYRDEATGRVPLLTTHDDWSLTSGWGVNEPPSASGGGPAWDIPHHPSHGYLAYLMEGRWTQLESCQFSGMLAAFDANYETRYDSSGSTGGLALVCINSPMTTRGAAWTWRSVGQAAAISPSTLSGADDAVQNDFAAIVQDTATVNRARYVTGTLFSSAHDNTVGWMGGYDGGDDGPATEYWERDWMIDFQTQALGHISEIGIEGLTSASHLTDIRDHSCANAVRKAGTEATWNFRRLAQYNAPWLKSSSNPGAPVFMTTVEAFASYKSFLGLGSLSADSGDTLKDHGSDTNMAGGSSSDDATGYLAGKIAALAYAVDAEVTDARTGLNLVMAASNFAPSAHGADDAPQFALVPRETPISLLALTMAAGDSSTALADNDLGSTIRATIQWQGIFHYDHANSRAHLLGKNASSQGSERSNCQYNALTNTWTGLKYGGAELGHVYDSIAYDPAAGEIYTGTWDSEVIKKWTYGDALDDWTDPVTTSTQELTDSTQPALCWHPNLYGAGDGGLLAMSESSGNGRLVAWRKSNNTWAVVSGTTHANSYTYPQRGGMCYVRGGDYVLAAFNPGGGGNTYKVAAGSGGALGTVSTVDDAPIECEGEDEGNNTGILLPDPTGASAAYILEKLGTFRVWKLTSTTWTLQGFTHPLSSSNGFYTVASCDPLGVFWRMAQDTGTSMLWRPDS